MNKNNHYTFTLVLTGVDESTIGLEDALYKSGCDDALINSRNGTIYLAFDRQAKNLENAIISAIQDTEAALPDIEVVSIGPDDYVSTADMAKRLNVSRQVISLWVKGFRRSNTPFPKAILKLTERSPLWRWHDVVKWLYQQNEIIKDSSIVENAQLIKNINDALLMRDKKSLKNRRDLLNKISR